MISSSSNPILNIKIFIISKILSIFLLIAVDKSLGQDVSDVTKIFRRLDTSLELNCFNSSNESIESVIWTLPNSNQSTNDPLIIVNLSKSDSGILKCTGFNAKGDEILTNSYHLRVGRLPTAPEDVKLLSVGPSELQTTWETIPEVIYQLHFDGQDSVNITTLIKPKKFLGLQPFTRYNLSISAFNEFGASESPTNVSNCTEPGIPTTKPSLTLVNITSTSASIQVDSNFESPGDFNNPKICAQNLSSLVYYNMRGPFEGYLGKFYRSPTTPEIIELSANEQESLVFDNLEKAKSYSLELSLFNGKEKGPIERIEFTTLDELADPPEFEIEDITDSFMRVTWSYDPKISSSKFKYETFYCQPLDKPPDSEFRIDDGTFDAKVGHAVVDNFKNNSCYCLQMASVNSAGTGNFSKCKKFETDYKRPKAVILKPVQLISHQGSNFVEMKWTQEDANSDLLTPQRSSLIYQYCYVAVESKVDTMMNNVMNHSKFFKLNSKGDHRDEDSEVTCVDIPSSNSNSSFSNIENWVKIPVAEFQGGKPTTFEFSIRAVTKSIDPQKRIYGPYSDGQPLDFSYLLDTKEYILQPKSLIFIIVVTVIVILLIICIILVLFRVFCRGYRGYELTHPLESGGPDLFLGTNGFPSAHVKTAKISPPLKLAESMALYDPIYAKDLVTTVNSMHASENAGFQLEFEAIEAATRTDWPANTAKQAENLDKNRYSNVFPFDHSRVILRSPANKKSNYINASYVDAFDKPNSYIAAQGPLTSTFDEFWQMVWEQNSRVIVMTSDFVERGRRKCDQYWPDEGKFQTYGNISVKLVLQQDLAFYSIRNFIIKNSKCRKNSKERMIFHYQYTDWRDFDVPISPLPVLKFVKITIQHQSQNTGPIIVHCSAGVGRTGTYICIESMIRQLIKCQHINIKAFLIHIRQQRMKLVQTETQFAFIYDAIKEYLLCPNHEVTTAEFPDYFAHLSTSIIELGKGHDEEGISFISGLQHQFMIAQGLMENKRADDYANHSSFSYSHKFFLSSQNRFLNDSNSTNLHGYYTLNEYNLITEQPKTSESIDEFWRLVWDTNCPLIVVLSQSNLQNFWPKHSNESMTIGSLRIAFCGIGKIGQRILRYEFLLSSDREDYALGCHLWQLLPLNADRQIASSDHTNGSTETKTEVSSTDMSKSTHTSYINGEEPVVSNKISASNPTSIHVKECGDGEPLTLVDNELLRLSAELSHVSSIQISRNEKRSGNNIGASLGSTDAFGSTIVIDDSRTGQGGMFCALCLVLNQIKHEKNVDVYFAAKMFLSQNPVIFRDFLDLEQIYKYIETFLKDQSRYVNSSFEFEKAYALNVDCNLAARRTHVASLSKTSPRVKSMCSSSSPLPLEIPTTPDLIENSYCSQNFETLQLQSQSHRSHVPSNFSNQTDEDDNASPLIDFDEHS